MHIKQEYTHAKKELIPYEIHIIKFFNMMATINVNSVTQHQTAMTNHNLSFHFLGNHQQSKKKLFFLNRALFPYRFGGERKSILVFVLFVQQDDQMRLKGC